LERRRELAEARKDLEEDPGNHRLSKRVALLEEVMETELEPTAEDLLRILKDCEQSFKGQDAPPRVPVYNWFKDKVVYPPTTVPDTNGTDKDAKPKEGRPLQRLQSKVEDRNEEELDIEEETARLMREYREIVAGPLAPAHLRKRKSKLENAEPPTPSSSNVSGSERLEYEDSSRGDSDIFRDSPRPSKRSRSISVSLDDKPSFEGRVPVGTEVFLDKPAHDEPPIDELVDGQQAIG